MEELLKQFEHAWQQRHSPPRIEDFLPPPGDPPSESGKLNRRQLLDELIRIDLEYRWRFKPRGCDACALEDYVAQFPELGPLNQLPMDLIGAEYFVRHSWGDCPTHAEYLGRFPCHGPSLSETLRRVDRKVFLEMRASKDAVSEPERADGGVALPLAIPVSSWAAPLTCTEQLGLLRQSGLLNETQLSQFSLAQGRGQLDTPEALARQLRHEFGFTSYQVGELLAGRGPDLLLGPYLLLDVLGEGGTGKVFKARHQRMNRLVALKVIRPELMSDAEVVSRFDREVKLVGQLVHPHIVHAYDAGPVGSAHVLVMEYLEGTDLGRVVRAQGPLSAVLAGEYVRQAALGLQYIHERGLVHRDIKPSNLLLAQAHGKPSVGLVKILDLGLGRLQRTLNGAAGNVITPTGAVMMGTPDYLAPEQAADFHAADIRADIYSLGCTLYFLLTGHPPFPGGTMAEKVTKHLMKEPTPVQSLRPDLPAGLTAVLSRMLAKRPEDRYQHPAEVAVALGQPESPTVVITTPTVPVASPQPIVAVPMSSRPSPERKRHRWMQVGGAALLLLMAGTGLALMLGPGSSSRPTGTSRVAAKPTSTSKEPDGAKEMAALKALIVPSGGEDRWLQVPWLSSLWQARQKAAAEGKPILLWEMSSHPLGGACACGIEGRVHIFSDPAIIRMARDDFVPVAADDWYLRRRQDSEGLFFRSVWEQSPTKDAPDGRQGVYCFTAAGKLLGYKYAARNVDGTREMLKSALDAWKQLPAESRKPGAMIGEPSTVDASLNRVPPPGTVVIQVFSRLLEKDGAGKYRRVAETIPGGALAARDHFWITAAEGKGLAGLSVSDRDPGPVLAQTINRLCRFHLLDNTRGEPALWTPEQIRSQKLDYKVQRTADHVYLYLDGTVLLASQPDAARADRGYDARLRGTIGWDQRRKVIDQFDVLAIGDAWGEVALSPGARRGRQPLGIVFALSRGEPTAAVPPFAARSLSDYLGSQK